MSRSAVYSKGCLQIPFGVCIGDRELGGTSVFAGLNIPKGVVGWWNFDDAAAQDISGNLVRRSHRAVHPCSEH
mgnify:CR=1 FL=1